MSGSVAGRLAAFLSATGFEALPGGVVERTKMAVADTLASALAGDESPSVRIVRGLTGGGGSVAEATLWGRASATASAVDTARANAVMADAMAFDESHLGTIAHLCGVCVPTAAALAERSGAGGAELISAVALGYEAAGRIGKAVSPGYMHRRGLHNSIVTVLGAAVAAGKLLALEEAPMTHAVALAATSAGGLAGSRNSPAREYHAGTAALLGIHAAMAAAGGYEGLATVLEDDEGYCRVFGAGSDPSTILRGLGDSWEIETDFSPKFMPGSHGIHTAVEAALGAFRQGGPADPPSIADITVAGPEWKTVYAIHRPRSVATASHSIPYFVARAALADRVDWNDLLDPERIADAGTWPIQDKVVVTVDPERPPSEYPGGATVTVRRADGGLSRHTVEDAPGTPARGFTWAEIEDKYRTLAPRGGVPEGRVEAALDALHALDTCDDVRALIRRVAGAG